MLIISQLVYSNKKRTPFENVFSRVLAGAGFRNKASEAVFCYVRIYYLAGFFVFQIINNNP